MMKRSLFLITSVLLVVSHGLPAATIVWSGGGSNKNWSKNGNWAGPGGVQDGDALVFEGVIRTSTKNNIGGNLNVAGITFSNDGTSSKDKAFTLTGKKINLGGDIVSTTVSSGNLTDKIKLNMRLTGDRTIDLGKKHNLKISGVISEGGGSRSLSKDGLGKLTLTKANTFTGGFFLNEGTLSVTNSAALGTGLLTMGLEKSILDMDGNAMNLLNDVNFLNTGKLVKVRLSNGGSASGELSGGIIINEVNAARVQFDTGVNDTLTLSGDISGIGGIYKRGKGTLVVSGVNTNTGLTTVRKGALVLSGGSAIADGSAVRIWNDSTARLRLDSNERVGSLYGGGTNGGTVNLQSFRLTTGDGTDRSFAGSIIGGAGSRLVKEGSGRFTLSGVNSYTGVTEVKNGKLVLSGGSAIHDDGLVQLADVSGAILQLNDSERIGALAGGGAAGGNVQLGVNTLTLGNASSTGFAGRITGDGGVSKMGSGVFTLSGINLYKGQTLINAGTLSLGVTGTIRKTSVIDVGINSTFDVSDRTSIFKLRDAQTLSGEGLVVGPLQVISGAMVSAGGGSVGELDFTGNMRLFSGSTVTVDLLGTGLGEYDVLNGDGSNSLILGGTLNVVLGYSAQAGDSYEIFKNWQGITGQFDIFNGGGLSSGLMFDTSQLNVNGTLGVIAVPEPGVVSLLALGVLSVCWRRKR